MSIREALGLPTNTNLTAHRTYRIWYSMKCRATKEWHHAYEKYQSLGVTIDPHWQGKRGFLNFLDDMGHPPSAKHSLERVDNHGAYTKANCVWALPEQQNRNKSNCHYVQTPQGRMTASEAARLYGLHPNVVLRRIHRGWPEHLLLIPTDRTVRNLKGLQSA